MERVGEVRPWLWARQKWLVAAVALGRERESEGEERRGLGRVRGVRGGAWRRAGDPGDERKKQDVAEDVAAACVVPGFSSAYWQEVEDGAAPSGLGRQVGWPAGPPGKAR